MDGWISIIVGYFTQKTTDPTVIGVGSINSSLNPFRL